MHVVMSVVTTKRIVFKIMKLLKEKNRIIKNNWLIQMKAKKED